MVGPSIICNSQKRETPAGAATAQRPLKEILSQDFQISLADLPILRTKTQAICDDLVSSFIKADFSRLSSNERSRMEEYQAILRKSAFTVEMSDSLAINARTLTAKGAVILNVGLLRALASSASALNNWDSVAFVIAHELSHTLYDRSTLLSVAEKSARYGSLDMENQCDRDAMLLMDVAGFNVRFADLSVLSVTQPEKARDFGVLSSHPHSEVRNLELAKLRNENYWSNYREISSRPFSAEDLSAINVPTKIELILHDLAGEAPLVAPDHSLRELCASALVRFKAALVGELQAHLIIDRGLLYGTIFAQKPASPKDIPAELVEEYQAYQQKVTPLNPEVSESDIVKQFIALVQRASKECFSHGDPSFSLEPLIREATRLNRESNEFYGKRSLQLSRDFNSKLQKFYFSKSLSIDKFIDLLEQLPAARDLPTAGDKIINRIFANSNIYELLMNVSVFYLISEWAVDKEALSKVENLTRVTLDKFGCGFFSHSTHIKSQDFIASLSRFSEVLASIGSEELMLRFGVTIGWDAALKVPFGKEVFTKNIARLADSHALPIESLESEQIRALLFGPRRSSPTNSMTDLAHESLQRGKLTEPLDLLMLLDYYTDISWKASDFTKVFESCIERSIPAEVTGSDRAEILSFWADKMLSVGIVPIAFQSPASADEVAATLRRLTPRHYQSKLLGRISPRLREHFDLAAHVSEPRPAELDCTEPKDSLGSSLGLHDFLRITGLRLPIRRPAQDPALPHDHGIELSHLEAAARHGNPRALGYLIQNDYFDTLERASKFLKSPSDKALTRDLEDLSESPLTGFLGPSLGQGEFVMYRYLQRSGFRDLRGLDLAETNQWVSSYLPHPGQLREIVLSRMCKDRFKQTDYTKEDAFAFLKLFEDTSPRRELFARQVYERFKDEYGTVSSRSSFICRVFPCASMARDALFEECLQQLSFKVSSFMEEIQPYLSSSSRSFQRAKSILDGTIGSAIDAWSLEVKREVAEWLFLHKLKPKAITYVEQGIYCKLDELPALMADKGMREELISKLFLGANGLASGSDLTELRLFLDNSLDSVFAKAHTSDLTRLEIPSKMETFARECIKATVVCSAPHRRETLLRKMFEIAANSKELAPEEFLARWLPAHSAAMIKGLQIIASRPEVRNHLPKLYEASKECKSHAPSMRIIDAMKAIVRNPSLRAEDPQIEGQVAAASIKAVYKARFGETLSALKVKQVTAGKDLAEGQAEIEEIYRVVQPLLTELFGIDTFPQIGRRIACAIASELDFTAEIRNSALLGLALADKRVAKRLAITVSTPRVDGQRSDDNVIVEKFIGGETLGAYLENTSGNKATLARVNQRLYLRLLKDGIVLSDLHQGNQMLQGPASMTLIDTGSLFKLDAAELRVFKNIILGLSSPVVPEFFLRRGIKAAAGDAYEKNKELIEERLGSLNKLAGAERPIALLALFDDIPDFYLSESLYWSILGLSKPFGLEQFHLGNIPEYQSVFTGAL